MATWRAEAKLNRRELGLIHSRTKAMCIRRRGVGKYVHTYLRDVSRCVGVEWKSQGSQNGALEI